MQNYKDNVIDIKRLSDDVEYYNNVFKKVEKIVSVLFYILSYVDTKDMSVSMSDTLKKESFKLHELSLNALHALPDTQTDSLQAVRYQLITIDSTVRVAEAGRVIAADLAQLLTEQIDVVQRYLGNHYLQSTGLSVKELHEVAISTASPATKSSSTTASSSPTKRARRVQVPAGDISSDAYMVYSQLTDRAERIKTVLEAKPQATVKDVAEIITDVSEKTIQRELNSLIEKGQVVREGERRWSKYSVVKD
jgi:hypothetical protein